ncbi:hypothetical protein [Clostridium sp.]|uniref:hypothetical protein n=1 Tax=Clostridium sp. TaxID=1506 RepID=UPI002638D14A
MGNVLQVNKGNYIDNVHIVGKDIITGEEISRGTSLILNLSSVIFHNSFKNTDEIITALKQSSRKTIKLDPERIRFSQSSVNGAGEIIESMKKMGGKVILLML